MIGILTWKNLGLFKIQEEKIRWEGVPCFAMACQEEGRFLPYRLRKVGNGFAKARVSRLLLPPDFPYWWQLKPFGLRPYDPLPLLQSLGADIALARLQQAHITPESAVVALVGEETSQGIYAVAERLCPLVQELVISFPQGGTALSEHLWQNFGMAPSRYRAFPHLRLCFHTERPCPGEEVAQRGQRGQNGKNGKKGIQVALDQVHSPDFVGLRAENVTIPPHLPPVSALAFLLEQGKIQKESLTYH